MYNRLERVVLLDKEPTREGHRGAGGLESHAGRCRLHPIGKGKKSSEDITPEEQCQLCTAVLPRQQGDSGTDYTRVETGRLLKTVNTGR